MHLNCNNKFEVHHRHHHHPAPLFLMICIPVPSEGALVYYYYYFIMMLSQNLCVHYLIGERNNQNKKSLDCLLSSSISEASKFFTPIAEMVYFFKTPSPNMYLRISCIFFLFFFAEILNK